MAHFAELDENNNVLRVLVISNNDILKDGTEDEETGIAFCKTISNKTWVQTSYTAHFRKNFAFPGYVYDVNKNAFIAPQPFPSWTLDADCRWQPPTPFPTDGGPYRWDEQSQSWAEVN